MHSSLCQPMLTGHFIPENPRCLLTEILKLTRSFSQIARNFVNNLCRRQNSCCFVRRRLAARSAPWIMPRGTKLLIERGPQSQSFKINRFVRVIEIKVIHSTCIWGGVGTTKRSLISHDLSTVDCCLGCLSPSVHVFSCLCQPPN